MKVGPIISAKDIKCIKRLLINRPRDRLLFICGCNSGLRVQDLLALKIGDVKYTNVGDRIVIREKKTGKENVFMKTKRSTSISVKIISLVLLSVAIVGILTIIVSYLSISNGFEKESIVALHTYKKVIDANITRLKQMYSGLARSQALRQNIINGLKTRDHSKLQTMEKELINAGQTEFMVITDDKGEVISRGHNDNFGDSIADQHCVKQALSGENCVTIEAGKVVKVSLRASSPVKDNGNIIGTIIVGMNITGSNKFVDEIKALMDIEATIFIGNVRESTTLTTDGKRMIGTSLDNPEISHETILMTSAWLSESYPKLSPSGL